MAVHVCSAAGKLPSGAPRLVSGTLQGAAADARGQQGVRSLQGAPLA